MTPAAWVVCADGPRAARWERVWLALGLVPRRAARLEDLEPGRGAALVDVSALRPHAAPALAALRARCPGLNAVACAGASAPPELASGALAAGALDLFRETDDDESLAARLKAHLKRLFPRLAPPGSAAAGRLRLDLGAREVRARRGRAWKLVGGLTAREFDLLAALARSGGAPLSREALLDVLGGDSAPEAVDKAVAALRRKLGPAGRALKTVRGFGYALG